MCAPGCGAPADLAVPEILLAAALAHATVARWTRLGATAFMLGIGAAALQVAVLSAAVYAASLVCLSVAWHHRRHTRYLRRWPS